MNNEKKISQLRLTIVNTLKPLIQHKVAIFGLPFHGNIGDSLIALGELQLLRDLNVKIIHRRQLLNTAAPLPKLPLDCTILLQGGGDFGDVWRGIQEERLKIISAYRNNRIIVLPQTVGYSDRAILQSDALRLRDLPDLYICARDSESFKTLNNNFCNNILLLPDMAFCINPQILSKRINHTHSGNLFLKRTDKELRPLDYQSSAFDDETVSDWPTADNKLSIFNYNLRALGYSGAFDIRRLHFASSAIQKISTYLICRYGYQHIADIGVNFLTSFNSIRVTRLHAAILAVLINKPVKLLDNSYHKNRNFFTSWLEDLDSISLI